MKKIIAIDGPAGSGKSSVTKALATEYALNHIDSGALFRGVALYFHHEKVPLEEVNAQKVDELELIYDSDPLVVKINGKDFSDQLREHYVSQLASQISQNIFVRDKMLDWQREIAKNSNKPCIVEGRDIGTVAFPEAVVKFFLTASSLVRAQRRMKQLKEKDPNVEISLEKIVEDIEMRDHRDKTREHAPLKQAKDAILVDSSEMSFEDVLKTMGNAIKEKL